jgi:calcineurin-like phosphoesterase family protein
MKIFLTSNQQFGRAGAIKAYNRPFDNVDEMDEYLIAQWNRTVTHEDTVFVLGNFAWDPEKGETASKRLNGTIFVIPGEWDKAIKDISKTKGSNVSYVAVGIKELPSLESILSYWPLVDWPKKKKGWVSFIGHPGKKYKSNHKENIANVRCDDWDFKPVDMLQITKLYGDPDLIS